MIGSDKHQKNKDKDKGSSMKRKMKKTKRNKQGKSNQVRPSFGITCFSEYVDIGVTNYMKCNTTDLINDPIRTGCSSLSTTSGFNGVTPLNELECRSISEDERVAARCCQPTPNTKYENSTWRTHVSRVRMVGATCLSVGCNDNQILTGCAGAQSADDGFGGVQLSKKQQCKVQKNGDEDALLVHAICTEQEDPDFELKCQTVTADKAEYDGTEWLSTVQCPASSVMFDCGSFLEDRINECTFSLTNHNDDALSGEYYYWQHSEVNKGKVYCKAVGDSEKVRAQATCCKLA